MIRVPLGGCKAGKSSAGSSRSEPSYAAQRIRACDWSVSNSTGASDSDFTVSRADRAGTSAIPGSVTCTSSTAGPRPRGRSSSASTRPRPTPRSGRPSGRGSRPRRDPALDGLQRLGQVVSVTPELHLSTPSLLLDSSHISNSSSRGCGKLGNHPFSERSGPSDMWPRGGIGAPGTGLGPASTAPPGSPQPSVHADHPARALPRMIRERSWTWRYVASGPACPSRP